MVDGDGRRCGARHPGGGRSRPGRSSPPARRGRDLVPQSQARAPDPVRDRPGRSGAPAHDRPDRGQHAADVRAWLGGRPDEWLAGIATVATDLHEPYRNGLSPHLAHAQRVADPFHVVGVANRCLDTVRRRVQQETLGHRAVNGTRSTASEESSCGAPSGSTSEATDGCSWPCASVTPRTRFSARGWPRSPSGTCIWRRTSRTPPPF